jgi:hypothetical protein
LTAPRVDRIDRSSLPARWSSPIGPQGPAGDRPATWKEPPNPFGIRFWNFLSLFKGQGAAVRGDDVSSTAGTATPAEGV